MNLNLFVRFSLSLSPSFSKIVPLLPEETRLANQLPCEQVYSS